MALPDQLTNLQKTTVDRLKTVRHDWFILVGLLFFSIVGVGITDASVTMSHWYWTAMVPVFFGACLFLEWQVTKKKNVSPRSVIIKQAQHWLGLLAAIYLTFFLRKIGSLNNETTGLILLLIIALTTYLAGVTMGWMFRLLGIFLGLSLFLVAYVENYIWIIIMLSLMVLITYEIIFRYYESHQPDE